MRSYINSNVQNIQGQIQLFQSHFLIAKNEHQINDLNVKEWWLELTPYLNARDAQKFDKRRGEN